MLLLSLFAAIIAPAVASYGETCPYGCNDFNVYYVPVCTCGSNQYCDNSASWRGYIVGKCEYGEWMPAKDVLSLSGGRTAVSPEDQGF